MKQYIVKFRISGKNSPEYYVTDSRAEAYKLLDELADEAEGWEDGWEGKVILAEHFGD